MPVTRGQRHGVLDDWVGAVAPRHIRIVRSWVPMGCSAGPDLQSLASYVDRIRPVPSFGVAYNRVCPRRKNRLSVSVLRSAVMRTFCQEIESLIAPPSTAPFPPENRRSGQAGAAVRIACSKGEIPPHPCSAPASLPASPPPGTPRWPFPTFRRPSTRGLVKPPTTRRPTGQIDENGDLDANSSSPPPGRRRGRAWGPG